MRFVGIFCLAVLAALVPGAVGIDLTGKCVPGPTNGTCANLAPFVWVNDTYTFATATANVDLLVANQAFLPTACIQAGLPYVCAEAFKPCVEVTYETPTQNLTVGIPARTCQSLCDQTNASCYDVLKLANLLYLIQCNNVDADGPRYPAFNTVYNLSSIGLPPLDVACNNGSNLETASNVTCPPEVFHDVQPGDRVDSPYNVNEVIYTFVPQYRDRCAIKCPNPQYSDAYWRAITAVWFSVCILSLALSCFTIVTFIVYPDRRKFPSILILHMTAASMIGAFSGTMVYWKGSIKGLLCVTDVEASTNNLAFIFVYGQHAILWWFTLIVFRYNMKRFYWGLVALGWGPPFVFMFAAIGEKDAQPGISWPFCSASIDGLLYIPIGVLGSIGTFASMGVICFIGFVTLRGQSDAKFWTLARRCVRPVLFGLICAIPYSVVYAYRFGNKPAKQQAQALDYVRCIISGTADCGSIPRTSPAFNYALSISLSCIGTLVFLCYSTHVKYFVDLKNWTVTRFTGLSSTLTSSGSRKSGSKHEDTFSVEMEGQPASRF